MRRIDLLAAYRAKQRARLAPLVTAGGILLAGILGLAGYAVYARREAASARVMLENAKRVAQLREQLQVQVRDEEKRLQKAKAALERRQARVDADRRMLEGQARAVVFEPTNGAATLVALAACFPPPVRWSMVEITPERVVVEGSGLDAEEVIRRVRELRRKGLEAELLRFFTRRRGGERILFHKIAVSHVPRKSTAGVPGSP